jgi:hypothetical protein
MLKATEIRHLFIKSMQFPVTEFHTEKQFLAMMVVCAKYGSWHESQQKDGRQQNTAQHKAGYRFLTSWEEKYAVTELFPV